MDDLRIIETAASPISRQNIVDLVLALFRGKGASIIVRIFPGGDGKIRGSHQLSRSPHRTHCISLFPDVIRQHVSSKISIGGNRRIQDVGLAFASVAAHEIQHANQTVHHEGEVDFYCGQYLGRPAEVDARRFVDENMDVISAILGVEAPLIEERREEHDIEDVVGGFLEQDGDVSAGELRDVLGALGMNNPANFVRVRQRLAACGKKIVR